MGAGDVVIGVNPASDDAEAIGELVRLLDSIQETHVIPTQTCVLSHVTTTLELIRQGSPVDLCFLSITGTQAANRGFGIDLTILAEAHEATRSLGRGTAGQNCMCFETGHGSCLSADAHHGVDQQTLAARAYVARHFRSVRG